jgi:hypothetical protein
MERSLTDAEIDALLDAEVFGHLACSDNGKPYIVPLAYVHYDNVLYGQTTEGKKIDILRKNPLVCFQVQRLKEHEWKSAMCWGHFEEFAFEKLDDVEAAMIIEILTRRLGKIQQDVGIVLPEFTFGQKNATPLVINGKTSTLFRVVVKQKTGKMYHAGT